MDFIINNSSMVPIYEQLTEQIKAGILKGELQEDTPLPSVRVLSKSLKISALTVKKAYDMLEEEGFVITVHGKGTYIAPANRELRLEEQKKEIEGELERTVRKGRSYGITVEELRDLFEMILTDF